MLLRHMYCESKLQYNRPTCVREHGFSGVLIYKREKLLSVFFFVVFTFNNTGQCVSD